MTPPSPPSRCSSCAAQQIKTSHQHNSYWLLGLQSKKKKKIKLLISIQQAGTSSGWQLSSLGQGQRK